MPKNNPSLNLKANPKISSKISKTIKAILTEK
jgi:hypothetical protein